MFFFFQAEDGIRDKLVTGVQTCALPIYERTTGMHWQTQKHGAEHFRRARAKNPEGRIPVSVVIGADPATALAGMLPIPPDLDEMMFAGFLRREPVEMAPCETNDLEVPANAEIVLEGYVNLNEMRTEGPFGDQDRKSTRLNSSH